MAKKKRRGTTGGPTGAEKQAARQKRLEEKRQAREEALDKQRKAAQRERMVRWAFIGLALALGIWFFFLRNKPPTEFDGNEVLASSQSGVGTHTEEPVTYDTVPPVSGPHSATPAQCGIHAEQIPNENQVHTLEHGSVGLMFDPTLDVLQIRKLEDIVNEYNSHMFSEPYDGMDSPIVVTAWGYRMPLEEVDETAIQGFIDEFRQNGPEDQPCPNASDTPFGEDDGSQDTVNPTGEESPSPGADDATPEGDEGGDQGGTPEPESS